jgi:di/tricarboxylate transporter
VYKDLGTLVLRFGDALLLHGPREKIRLLTDDPDFVLLSRPALPARRTDKAPVALGSLGLMILLVATGWYPIHVAAFAGAVSTVLFGALKMEQAYRAIEWRAIFLVAAILPVGVAMERSGAAEFLSDLVVRLAGAYGPYGFLAALVILSSMLSQGLDGAPTVVILAPVVFHTAEQLGVSPYPLMMAVGLAASAAFMTPFSHKANLLVMSAGGYKPMDYVKVGTPLTILVLALIVILVPVFFPL